MLSTYQAVWIQETEASPNFDHWCLDPKQSGIATTERRGPLQCTFYTKDGILHTFRLGQHFTLAEAHAHFTKSAS